MSITLLERLRQAAKYTLSDSMRELLIEAAESLDSSEPVGWTTSDVLFSFRSSKFNAAMMMPSSTGLKDPVALYTAPQPQERKPLSEWQIVDIVHAWGDGKSLADLMRAVEAAHGIKE